jgi:DNA primase large subunit
MNFEKYRGLYVIDSSCLNQQELTTIYDSIKEETINIVNKTDESHFIKDSIILVFNILYVKLDQLVIYNDPTVNYNSNILLTIVDFEKERIILSIYIILKDQWKNKNELQKSYKNFRLNTLVRLYQYESSLPLSLPLIEQNQNQNQCIDNVQIENEKKKEKKKKTVIITNKQSYLIDTFFIGNLHSFNINIEIDQSFMHRYISILFDYILYIENFSTNIDLKTKMVNQYIEFIKYNEHQYYHSHYMIQFIHYIMKYTKITLKNEKSIIYDELSNHCPFANEWISFEVTLFKYSIYYDLSIDRFYNILKQHISFIKDRLHSSFYPNWFDYYIEEEEEEEEGKNVIWKKEDSLFKIKFEWLLKFSIGNQEEDEELNYVKFSKGYIYLDELVFKNIFLPLLYKLMLNDILIYMYYINFNRIDIYMNETNYNDWLHYDDHISESSFKSFFDDMIKYKKDLFTFKLIHGHHSTPIMKQMEKKDKAYDQFLIDNPLLFNKGINYEDRFSREFHENEIPDIEDLFNSEKSIFPPCIKRVLKQDHIKHLDRLNLTKYLIDIGYKKDIIIDKICSHYPSVDENHIESIYNNDYNNKRKGNQKGSLFCKGVMNNFAPEGNNIRCIYEENLSIKKKKREKLSFDEATDCQSKCLENLMKTQQIPNKNLRNIFHPLDYMKLKTLNK